ncbi:MAG: hydroxymethylglutaryl-CoA lyase [Castellaniella sp.]|uniref:hydroxymethylglutaryl-CoA lyase n=1 Tax=Castellaniella sp. TaxID=1955812 RepID=UPI003A903276
MMPDILINEVGPRDGLQSQHAAISLDGKLTLIRALIEAGIRSVEAGSFVSPKAVPQMADADQLYPQLPDTDRVQYSALVPNLRGLERAQAARVQEIAVVLSATNTMNKRNINLDLAQTVASCTATVKAARQLSMRAKAYVAVAFECPYEGRVSPDTVLMLAELMMDAGAQEIVIADTIGAANPAQVGPLLGTCIKRYGADRVSAHFHDTRGFALANVWASIEAGVRKFDTSVGGLGGCPFAPGAAGNVATEDVVLMAEQCGFRTGVDIARLREAIKSAELLVGYSLGGRTTRWLNTQFPAAGA